ncbi:MAG: UDP-N-acetylglucosamine 2-epimerase (hydrolyzing) [Alphaproteobacteria bacterium]|nr:UDP-N-acetylglucosamine 2-epimerase (hydrolyzing) [Alphaproteobacteria bacterium]
MNEPFQRLLFITGTRADFGKLKPLIDASVVAGYDVEIFITGMHLLEEFGLTKVEVLRTEGVRFFEFINQNYGDAQDVILTKTIIGISDRLRAHHYDLVISHGDRVEALAASIVCSLNNIRSAHVEGGEVSGTVDESMRHCNSKLCTTHFVSSEVAALRLRRLGESLDRIFVIGSPELDLHSRPSGVAMEEVRSHYEITFDEFGIVVFHPVVTEQHLLPAQVDNFKRALLEVKKQFVIIAPNNDPGHEVIVEAWESIQGENFRFIPSMRFAYFSELMKHAAAIIGNSSLGVREAPFLGVPSINLGTRQFKRSVSELIVDVVDFEVNHIVAAIENAWGEKFPSHAGFGHGNAARMFVETINDDGFWKLPIQKVFED